jgi:hypothetical protein
MQRATAIGAAVPCLRASIGLREINGVTLRKLRSISTAKNLNRYLFPNWTAPLCVGFA